MQISNKFVPRGSIDKRSTLVQVMAWCQIGDKQLIKPMLTKTSVAISYN